MFAGLVTAPVIRVSDTPRLRRRGTQLSLTASMQRDLLPPVMPSITRSAGGRDWIYTPVGTPQNSWRPTVTSVTANSNGSFHLSGTRLTGFVSVGEDDQDPQNFRSST